MTDSLLTFSNVFLWVAVGIVLAVLLVLVLVFTVVRQSARAGGTSLSALISAIKDGEEEGQSGTESDLPVEPTKAAMKGPAASFRRAIGFLRATIGGQGFRYHMPWFLVAGDPGSGKFSLMNGVGANLAQRERDPRDPLYWHFLDGGVLLGLAGRCWKSGRTRGEFAATLRLLRNHRPRRPVDGVVFTIAATDLAGPAALDEAALAASAARYTDMFSQAQRALGFTFPVYVVVTKCDQIDGFREFCRELPAENRDNIFGWSSPYHLDAAFSPEWVEEAFENIARDLQRLQSEIFVERSELASADRLYLFPENFARLCSPLYVYLDRLFRETSYREAFRFRGVYFCGDLSESAPPLAPDRPRQGLEAEVLAGEEIAAPGIELESTFQQCRPAFLKDLFVKKIFPEAGVARPLARVFSVKSRAARAIQAGAALLALILALGTGVAYHRMRVNRDLLHQPLVEMYTQRVDPNNLLQELNGADQVSFSSVFLPASLFSSVDEDVTSVMRRATETWIMGTLQRRLTDKKTKLLHPPPEDDSQQAAAPATEASQADATPAPAPTLVPSLAATPEFQELKDFHDSLKSFQEYVDVYEQLRKTGKPGDLTRIQKLLDYLGLNQVQPRGHLLTALSTSTGPPVIVSPDESKYAVDNINALVAAMFEDWSANNALVAHADRLRQAVGSLEQGTTDRLVQRLRGARDSLHAVETDLASPDYRWALSPTLVFDDAVKQTLNNPIDPADNGILTSAQIDGQRYLDGIRGRLLDERTSMTDQLLVGDPFGLSPQAQELRLALENVLNLRFMTEIPVVRSIQIRLAENQRLMWRIEPILEALRLHDIYAEFVRSGLRGSFEGLRVPLSRVALEQLKRHVEDLIAESQDIQVRPNGTAGLSLDDSTLPEVNSFREAVGPLQQLADAFQTDGVEIRNSVLRILVNQAYDLLAVLDGRLAAENAYAIKPGNWLGKGSMALASFDARNTAALNDYLATQRDRIRFLEKQAEPLVPFIDAYLPVRAQAQNRLITKWGRIVDDYHQYDNKRPNASLTALEDFVLTDMDKIQDNSCNASGPSDDDTADYFLQVRNTLRRSAMDRCQDVASVAVCHSYGAVADVFNRTLASKFPFAPIAATKTQPEATAEAIRAFYDEFDRSARATRSLLQQDSRFGDVAQRAIQFLNQMEALRPLVLSSSPDAAREPPLTLNFSPQFRTNRANESGGSQVSQWDLQVGGQIIQQRQEHDGTWRPGNPVRLSLRWASDSTLVPAGDAQPDLRIIQRNAFFEFTNRWALLSFLRRHEVASPDADAQTYTLRFSVKTQPDPKWASGENAAAPGVATVFMQLRLSAPGSKTALRLPPFPVAAPVLTSACEKN